MLRLKQLQDAAACRQKDCVKGCCMFTSDDGTCGECTEASAKTALAYREVLKLAKGALNSCMNTFEMFVPNKPMEQAKVEIRQAIAEIYKAIGEGMEG